MTRSAWPAAGMSRPTALSDAAFDGGKGVTAALHLSRARRSLQEQQRVPSWMMESLDREAGRHGVTRQSIINVRLAEGLAQTASER